MLCSIPAMNEAVGMVMEMEITRAFPINDGAQTLRN